MPVEPIPCADGGSTPVEVITCCSPSIASAPLCRADGSTVLVVVRSGCVECGEAAEDPAVVGWLDVAGVFTPGALPADVGPCDAGCVDTVCRQLCDDTNGDGEADATYSELWCIRLDGTAELVLTYQDDPSVPYTPVSPVECTYGCPDSETVTLCDDSGPFLRRYTWLQGVATFEDFDLDGVTPHVVTGTVGVCEPDASAICVDTICRQRCDDTDGDGEADATYSELWCIRLDGTAELVLTYQDDPSVPYVPVAPVACEYANETSEILPLCDDVGPFLRRYSWLGDTASFEDVALDGVTPYVVTGTVGVCEPDASAICVDTVCRQRCDDTDGDGVADATYSELWCVQSDGTADLVLTYQDDPSVPYVPVAPVACEYANEASEILTLCDDVGPFLRRYSWLGDTASFEDVALDGVTPYAVTGAVGVCSSAASECEAQTTPAATLGLCLADGTPIAVVVTRDCTGAVTQDGWINLTTGTYSAGDPPVGTMACGNPRSISTTGTFCDVDPGTGDVLGLVLIEYTYGADGAVESVRLVDATTGTTYVPAGEITTCPAGVEQPERDLVQLCDTAVGVVTEFVRDFARDENGQIVGFTDYTLDGAPYAPTGTVGRCNEQCQDCEQVVLCDMPADTSTARILRAGNTVGAASGTLVNGVSWTTGAGTAGVPNVFPISLFPLANTAPFPITFSRPVAVEWDASVGRQGTAAGVIVMPVGTVLVSLAANHLWNPATRTLSAVVGAPALNATSPVSKFRHAGPVTALSFASDGTSGIAVTQRRVGNFDVTPVAAPFLRTTCRGCDGTVTAVTSTLLDGTTAYVPVGTVGVCPPGDDGEGCTNGTTVLLCDQPAGESGPVNAAITDATSADVGQTQFSNLPGPYTSLWSGGSLIYPAGAGPAQQHAQATGRVTAVAPTGCEVSGGTLTVSVRVTQNGPGTGQAWDGALRLFRGTTLLAANDALTYAPPGYTKTLTVSAPVTAADLTSGAMFVSLPLETFHGTAKQWTADQFSATVELDDCESSESVQFLRTVVTDCETGAVVSTSDTTLDGDPYTVGGDVAQCEAASEPAECCETAQTLILCDIADDGTSTPFMRRLSYLDGAASVSDFALDGVTPYEALGTVGLCPASAEDCPANTVFQVCRCDDADGDGVADTDYVELLAVDCDGVLTSLGTYTADLDAPYTPVAPIDCAETDEGAEPAIGIQARRVELTAGETWDAADWTTLQSVTAIAHGGTGTVTTDDGPSTLHTGEAATWSVARDTDALLTGPLTITADTGTVTLSYTIGVTL